jgi:hypothetical protein
VVVVVAIEEGRGDSLNENVADAQMKLPPLCLTRLPTQKVIYKSRTGYGRGIGCNEPATRIEWGGGGVIVYLSGGTKEREMVRPAGIGSILFCCCYFE